MRGLIYNSYLGEYLARSSPLEGHQASLMAPQQFFFFLINCEDGNSFLFSDSEASANGEEKWIIHIWYCKINT